MSELENALGDSQTPQDVPVSSTENTGEPAAHAETPAPQVEQKEPPFNEHPRWIEVQRDRDYLRDTNAALMKLMQIREAAPVINQPDPYANLTPEEKNFWKQVDERAETIAQRKIESVRPQVEQELRETKEAVASMAYERFQLQHPDVKPGSQEENAIAQYFQRGYSLDDAYKVVMFDRIGVQKAQQVKDIQVNKVQQKIAANVETKGISSTSNLSPKMSFREALRKGMQEPGWTP